MFAHAFGWEYIRKPHTNLWAVIWDFGTEQFSQLLGGHQPSAMAVLLPLME